MFQAARRTVLAAFAAVALTATLAVTASALPDIPVIPVVPVIPTVEDARRLVVEGRWNDARRAYTDIVDNARITRDYAKAALEELASLQYMMENVKGAARTYEQLGAEAEIYGDPETEITARFRAAILYQEARDNRGAAAQMDRIKALLKSPVVSDTTRESIKRRIRS